MHKTIFFVWFSPMYSDTFRFLLRNSSLYTFVTFYRWCEMRARFFNFFLSFLIRFHMLFGFFIKNWRYYNVILRADTTWLQSELYFSCNRKGGQMDDDDSSNKIETFEQVSWRSVWCCLKSKVTQSSVINCLHSFFGFYVIHAWFLWWSKSK